MPVKQGWFKFVCNEMAFTSPTSITEWNFANADWHCPRAQNDLREGGTFSYRMEARDGSYGFDFEGTFRELSPPNQLRSQTTKPAFKPALAGFSRM